MADTRTAQASATGRGGGVTQALPRIANDFYPTEARVTQALIARERISGLVLEPCAGQGHISKELKRLNYTVVENDITWPGGWDAASWEDWRSWDYPMWTITNPPFNQATPILQNAYTHSIIGVAMLLRMTYLEPCKDRAEWLIKHPPTRLIILNPRPRFRADTKGQDSVTVAWFVWRKDDKSGNTKIDFANDWKV